MFISNQAYNICLNLQQENWERNKNLAVKDRIYPKASEIDEKVKQALKSALTIKDHGFPKFKNSKLSKQSFNWNNQGFSLHEHNNSKYKILRIMSQEIKFTYSRAFPENAKVKQLSFSKERKKYFVSFTLEFQETVFLKTKENLELKKAVGINLNIDNIALSKGELIKLSLKTFQKENTTKISKDYKGSRIEELN